MNDKPQFLNNPFTTTYCEMFNCTRKAEWLVGRPNNASLVLPGSIRLCDQCAASVARNLPDELLPHVNVERALELLDEERRDAIFDKFFPSTEPMDVLKSLLETVEREKVETTLTEMGFIPKPTPVKKGAK